MISAEKSAATRSAGRRFRPRAVVWPSFASRGSVFAPQEAGTYSDESQTPSIGATLTCSAPPPQKIARLSKSFDTLVNPAQSALSTRFSQICPVAPQNILRGRAAAEILSAGAKPHVFCSLTRSALPGSVLEMPGYRDGPEDPIHARRGSPLRGDLPHGPQPIPPAAGASAQRDHRWRSRASAATLPARDLRVLLCLGAFSTSSCESRTASAWPASWAISTRSSPARSPDRPAGGTRSFLAATRPSS